MSSQPLPAPGAPAALGASRMPAEPYPGLRPFLDHEEILLFGRERQVREVIERLQQTQFVAVIGGSGSGKSSLILAGVVPELRSFGIPGAGDYWVPMVCTPGTNASASDQAQRLNTPITRLARKFAGLLRSRGSVEQDAVRLEDIAARLREELGFSTLVDVYADELAVPSGPLPQDARFLFVIDQFEELFHPTTRHTEDARLLVERVIDHFFSPHPRCFVVLTMRSEHLNDCAGYLELPDAINKASYLVRRLDESELREAITQPAERLLRLRRMADEDSPRLPADVLFEDAVTERLLRDARAISDDPDHLPLLQHVLARVWQAACQRVAPHLDLPDRIVASDLAVAVSAQPAALALPVADGVNTLRTSLERWAEASYLRHSDSERRSLDAVLRRLAIKDPNTGMYSQQRIQVDEGLALLGPQASPGGLKALLADGFLGEVDYLYWDDDDPKRITLKVSHESLIRGWPRLRQVIDGEAERFAAFVELLRKCDEWQRKGRSDELLLEASDLRRARDAAVQTTLAQGDERAGWFRRLEASNLHDALGQLGGEGHGDIDEFLRLSFARQQLQRDTEGKRRRNRLLLAMAVLLLLPMGLYALLVQGPVIGRTAWIFQAGSLANAAPLRRGQADVGSEAQALRSLVDAAALIDRGRRGDNMLQRLNRHILQRLPAMPFVGGAAEFVEQVGAVAEPVVNGSLRQLLESSLWLADVAAPSSQGVDVSMAQQRGEVTCVVERAGAEVAQVGQLFSAFNTNNPSLSRNIFVPNAGTSSAEREEVELRSAEVIREPLFDCVSKQVLTKIPKFLTPQIVFDANLRFLLVAATDRTQRAVERTVTVSEILWERADDEGGRSVRSIERVVLSSPGAVEMLRGVAAPPVDGRPDVALLAAQRMSTGRAFVVGSQAWRIIDQMAQRIPAAHDDAALHALQPSSEGSQCMVLQALLVPQVQPGFTMQMLEDPQDERYCFSIQSGVPRDASPKTVQFVVAVYGKPTARALGLTGTPASIASLPRFGRARPEDKVSWKVGKAGEDLSGWIALWGPSSTGTMRHLAAPWSTCALWRLGTEVLMAQDSETRQAKDPKNREVCQWQ